MFTFQPLAIETIRQSNQLSLCSAILKPVVNRPIDILGVYRAHVPCSTACRRVALTKIGEKHSKVANFSRMNFITQLDCKSLTCFFAVRKAKLVYPNFSDRSLRSFCGNQFVSKLPTTGEQEKASADLSSQSKPNHPAGKQQQSRIFRKPTKMTDLSSMKLLKPLNVLVYIDTEQYDKSKLVKLNRASSNGSHIDSRRPSCSSFDRSVDSGHESGQTVLNIAALDRSDSIISTESLPSEYYNRLFGAIQTFLTYFLSQKFTIYATSLDELNRRAWFGTTKLLIVVQNDLDEVTYLEQPRNQVIKEFQGKSSSVIVFNRALVAPPTDLPNFELNVELLKSKIQQKLGTEIIYENFHIPELTTHYIYSDDLKQSSRLHSYVEKELHLKAKLCEKLDEVKAGFDAKLYLQTLSADNKLGRNLIVADVTKSTQPIAESAPFIDGLVVITNQQTEGKGRGKNQWLSPEGSISFTYAVSVSMNSALFKYLAFFQHVNALAILLAIKKFPNMNQLDLKIKWPNDIYYKSRHKLVGILTNSKFEGNCAKFFIGTGINLSNSKPTYSLKNIVEEECPDSEFAISKEALIAEILNQIHGLIKLINNQGKEKIVDLYYENWMLTDKIIQLEDGKQANILGLDEDGYLRVNLLEDGEIVSLLPDGNRFDIMEQMIINPSS